jgi:hypothetical protein
MESVISGDTGGIKEVSLLRVPHNNFNKPRQMVITRRRIM